MERNITEILKVANEWKENSLILDQGFLWTDEDVWSEENISRFRTLFIENPDTSTRGFYEKLESQLINEDVSVYKYIIEVMYIYFSVTLSISYKVKRERLNMIASWKNLSLNHISEEKLNVLKYGVANTGGGFNTNIYNEIKMIHIFAEKLKVYATEERQEILQDPKRLKQLSEETRKQVGFRAQMQHMILFYLKPDYFEDIASWSNKNKIVSTYEHLIAEKNLDDIDDKLYYIKEQLKEDYEDDRIDFYQTDFIRETWQRLSEDNVRYFWLHMNKEEYNHSEGIVLPDKTNNNRRRIHTAFDAIQENDKAIFYEVSPITSIRTIGHVSKIEYDKVNKRRKIYFTVDEKIQPVQLEDLTSEPAFDKDHFVHRGTKGFVLNHLTKEQFDTIVRLGSADGVDEPKTKVLKDRVDFNQTLTQEQSELVFENEEVLYNQIQTALKNGDHIILTGPPGTGKSKLAKSICNAYGVQSKMVTASSNWSTYDTIGGYRPNRDGHLYFDPGVFLDSFKDKATGKQKNEWLIVDEINRADIDKAFGSLFSVLTGDAVHLPYEARNGKQVTLKMADGEAHDAEHEYVISKDWRMIGTMNTIDKASLFEMSYAFMRRFAFIPVAIPRNVNESLMKDYLTMWGFKDYPYARQLIAIWNLINEYRKIGPAIIRDLAIYTNEEEDFVSAIILYVLPQFEGLSDVKVKEFVERLEAMTDIIPETSLLKDFVEDFFQQGEF